MKLQKAERLVLEDMEAGWSLSRQTTRYKKPTRIFFLMVSPTLTSWADNDSLCWPKAPVIAVLETAGMIASCAEVIFAHDSRYLSQPYQITDAGRKWLAACVKPAASAAQQETTT